MIPSFTSLSWEQSIVAVFLIVEMALVTLIVILSYLGKIWAIVSERRQHTKAKAISTYFHNKNLKKAPPHLKDLNLIFSELKKTKALSDEEKKDFVKTHLIHRTRPLIHSRNFVNRYYLIESYHYVIAKEDKQNLLQLMEDPARIISINATYLSGLLVDASIYKKIIEVINTLDWTTQKLYIAELPNNQILLDVIKEYLQDKNISLSLRKLCYEIALPCIADKEMFQLALDDVEHLTGDCQLAAIRIMALSDPDLAKNKLFELYKSKNWLIRNTVVQSLSQIKTHESLELLAKCLNDENYWVRVNSTKALLNVGDEGRLLLTEYLASEEAKYQPVASYFLDIQKMKEQL